MPIIGLDLTAKRTLESRYDTAKGTPEATKFEIGTLDSRVHGYIKDMATTFTVDPTPGAAQEEVQTSMEQSLVNFTACQFGLRGWSNLKDAEGNDLPFKTRSKALGGKSYQVVSDEVLRQVPGAVLSELAVEILKANDLTDAQGNA